MQGTGGGDSASGDAQGTAGDSRSVPSTKQHKSCWIVEGIVQGIAGDWQGTDTSPPRRGEVSPTHPNSRNQSGAPTLSRNIRPPHKILRAGLGVWVRDAEGAPTKWNEVGGRFGHPWRRVQGWSP